VATAKTYLHFGLTVPERGVQLDEQKAAAAQGAMDFSASPDGNNNEE
jgi:hypothetical protein